MSVPSDQLDALMARLARGDRTVFAGVFASLWSPVHRLCCSLLRNEADASDAAQEAMCKILEQAADYDPTRPALPWALTIAMWECRTLIRRRGRKREQLDGSLEHQVDDLDALLVQRDLVRAALSALRELSEPDREALIATFEGREASVSGPVLRKRRERALERLRTAFRRLYGID